MGDSTLYAVYRIGTCGGIGLPPGSVVVTDEALDGRQRPTLDTVRAHIFEIDIYVFGRLKKISVFSDRTTKPLP